MIEDFKVFLHPIDTERLLRIKHSIFNKIQALDVTYYPSSEPTPYEERFDGQRKIRRGKIWGHIYDCAWFHFTGKVPEKYQNEDLVCILDTLGEGLIVDEGKIAKQGTSHIFNVQSFAEFVNPPIGKTVYHLEKGKHDVDIWLEAGYNGIGGHNVFFGMLKNAAIATFNQEMFDYYFDYLALALAKYTYKGNDYRKVSNALDKSFIKYITHDIVGARNELKDCLNEPSDVDLTVYSVGHSHLDLAWLWPIRETKRKAARTLSTQIKNMHVYDDYVYGASQPQELEWIENDYPEIVEELKKLQALGKFEPQGGMWVECDTNITGGESLIRQFLYGMKYWEEKFNKTVNNCWLPDVFGYSAALPQIIKKCGIDYFMTQKLSWNNVNDFPLQTFNWEGLSQDDILVHLLPGNNYNSTAGAPSLVNLLKRHKRKDKVTNNALMLFGAGDGGGGACEADIELIKRYKDLKGIPKLKFSRAETLFEKLGEQKEELPRYKGELYLEKHQGTYTTQSNIKKNNRKCEQLMHTLEAIGSIAKLQGYNYPYDKVEKLWKNILLFQFHDILPGSSITRVYKEANIRYEEMEKEIQQLIYDAANFIKESNEKSIYNPSPIHQSGYIVKDGIYYKYDLPGYSSSKLIKTDKPSLNISFSENTIENKFLKVTFNNKGYIDSVIDKNTGFEFSNGKINALNIYYDKKTFYNAWDIDINYTKHKPKMPKLINTNTYIEDLNVIVENTYKFNKSKITQRTILNENLPYITFDTTVDWHETHKMLRAEFIPSVYSDKVECDIQFGHINRSTKTDNKIDWAQFEICAHKYVDVSANDYGSSVISNSKYGYRVKDGIISLNLLRSPVYPDKTADRGIHNFKYAYYPHQNDSRKSKVIEYSYNFNYEPILFDFEINVKPLVLSSNDNIIIETIKPAEDGANLVVRLYECCGNENTTTLTFNKNYTNLYESDMRENNKVKVGTTLTFKPFEIKTLIIE